MKRWPGLLVCFFWKHPKGYVSYQYAGEGVAGNQWWNGFCSRCGLMWGVCPNYVEWR